MRYKFTIWYQTPNLRQVNDFMIKCDIYKQDTVITIEEKFEFKYTGIDRPISYFKDLLKQAMESLGNKLINCEGGPIE
jgi:hypothetical protein